MSRNTAPEDLLVLARRDRLDEEDERRLELSLNSSRELSLLYEAGIGFDAEASLLPGDEARSSELVERTLRQLPRQPVEHRRLRPSARYFALSMACGVLLSVAVASAWQYVSHRFFAAQELQHPHRPAVSRPAPVAAPVAPVPGREPAAKPEVVAAPPVVTPPLPAPAGPAKVAAPPSAGSMSARELFTRAAAARRQGDVEGAIALYEQLGQQYPDSIEAHDARLLLGNLRLEQRAPRAALNQFESYGGPLSLEALWGKAEALRKLESPAERAALEELLREYPSSPYAAAAKKRLEQLAP